MSAPPPLTQPTHTLLYDGDCGLCDRTVQFIFRRNRHHAFTLTAQQSPAGQQALRRLGLPSSPSSVVVVRHSLSTPAPRDIVFTRSAAVIEIYSTIGGGWRLLATCLWLIPRPVRDFGYGLIARWRYRFFGRARSCMLPPRPSPSGGGS